MTARYGDPHEAAALSSLRPLRTVPGRPRRDRADPPAIVDRDNPPTLVDPGAHDAGVTRDQA